MRVAPQRAAKKLGFAKEQIEKGLLVPYVGNTYSGATPLGLSAVLDEAESGQRILVTSYGSGAGSDAFIIETTKELDKYKNSNQVRKQMEDKEYVDYAVYAKLKGKIKGVGLKR